MKVKKVEVSIRLNRGGEIGTSSSIEVECGTSPLVVSEQAIKQNPDISKCREVYTTFESITNCYESIKDKCIAYIKYKYNNLYYQCTADAILLSGVNKAAAGKNPQYYIRVKLTNVRDNERYYTRRDFFYTQCSCSDRTKYLIKVIRKDAKIDWNTNDLTEDSYQAATKLDYSNYLDAPYGFSIETTGNITSDDFFRIYIPKDTSQWKRFKLLNTKNNNIEVYGCQNIDTSNALIFDSIVQNTENSNIKGLDFNSLDFSNVKILNFKYLNTDLIQSVGNINTSNVVIMSECFKDNTSTSLNLIKWKTDKVTSMISMFEGCTNLTKLDLSTWNVRNVTSFQRMFYGCTKLKELDLSGWDMAATANVTDMFVNDTALKKIIVKNCTQYTLDLIRKALKDSNYSWTYNGIAFIII